MPEPVCLIKCNVCKQMFPSPMQFATAEAFFGSTLAGNMMKCGKCGEMSPCNKSNMYFNDREGGIWTGEETVPT